MPERKSFLPFVVEDDLLILLVTDVTDSTHEQRWKQLTETNPTLARELLQRAYMADALSDSSVVSSTEIAKRIIDITSFAISALEIAARRVQLEADLSVKNVSSSDGDVDDEAQQL